MRRLIVLAVAVILITCTGCSSYRDIKINSAKVESLSPYGIRKADVDLAVEIDNPTVRVKLYDMEATLEHSGKVLGKITLDPFILKGRTVETYNLKGHMSLDKNLTLADLMVVLDKNFMDNCVVDFTVKGKVGGALTKTVTRNDVPLKKLLKYAEK